MELTEQVLNKLVICFTNSNNPTQSIREEATNEIKNISKTPGFLMVLLKMLDIPSVDLVVKQMAAICFKNVAKESWLETDDTENPIPIQDKNSVKEVIVNVILAQTNNPLVQNQLLAAMTIIGDIDFPQNWPNLLPELVQVMSDPNVDFQKLPPILKIMHSILKKYRNSSNSQEVLKELQYILTILPEPFLNLFIKTGQQINVAAQNEKELFILFTSIHYLLEIFHSMSCVDLPEFFEDNLEKFTTEFHRYLQLNIQTPSIVQSKSEEEPSLLNNIHTVICDIINLYTQKYDEEFQNHLQSFVQDVWGLLSKTNSEPRNDHFIYSSVKFLSTVSMSIKHDLFNSEDILRQICSSIVLPNIQLREGDIELYEDNPVEYMRKDIEGSDSDTRRRASIDLVRGLRKYFESVITRLLMADIQKLLQQHQSNPAEYWMAKDSAIFLVTALAVRAENQSANQLVPIMDFYKSQIEPELLNPQCQPILRADCLKFISIFRTQIPAQEYTRLLQHILPCLESPDYIIHTYAATCIDRLLTVKDNGVARISPDFVSSHLSGLLLPLVNVFNFPCSKQNERAMRTIVRIVLMTLGKIDLVTTTQLLQKFVNILLEEAKNPLNQTFNHYCFEVVGSMLKSYANIPEVIHIVIPMIEYILQKDVVDFSPYNFQLLAILVENSPPEFMDPYRSMVPIICHPNLWKRHSNIPPLVRLFQAYFKKDAMSLVANKHLEPILGIFQNLLSSPANDHEGFYLLEAIVENLPLDTYKQYIVRVLQIILERISKQKTSKVVRCFIIFYSLFIIKVGVEQVCQITKTVRPDLWEVILKKLFIPTTTEIKGKIEKKIISIAITNLLSNAELFAAAKDVWVALCEAQLNIFKGKETESAHADDELYIDKNENVEGYTPTFSQLQFSKKQDSDPFPQIDPKSYFDSNSTIKSLAQQANVSI
ncbi:hypothetical protein CYY_004312 [Polysphondylium violaceum]|uniref:Importin N-terminal domain-containing protein n=1 Tax=Polysphondylium violaceum TaxID=133409 RepID=A0A8J4PUT2_9MYCE|nr:hypothetical protein CYY_004312 [Polysphondylium violaceum]